MPENRDDRMMLTLDALRKDVERTPLADSLTVRRRGDQRTRRQAVGGALAVVALVAGAAGIYGGLDGNRRATEIPASPSPSAEPTLDLAPDPFLRGSDVTDIGPYSLQRSPSDVGNQPKLQECMPRPEDLGAAKSVGQFFYSDLDATATEHVLRFASADQATGVVADLEKAFFSCPEGDPAEVTVQDRPPAPVRGVVTGADTALHASRTGTPKQASEISYYELGVVREGNVVVVLQWSSMGQPTDVDWVWDGDRMTTALTRAVG